MRLQHTLWILFTLITAIHALTVPDPSLLFKRKGGGGGGGASGGRGGGSSGSSGGSSGSSGSGGRGSTGSSGSSGSSGSGTRPSYGGSGGRAPAYSGGSTTPYRAGNPTPGGVRPFLYGAGAAALLFPGLWLVGAYAYTYPRPYTYHNDTTNMNDTRPVTCLCEEYQQCGCDSSNDTSYIDTVANNASLARVANVNGTESLVINGTLPNDTDASSNNADTGAGVALVQGVREAMGWWVVVAGVGYAAFVF